MTLPSRLAPRSVAAAACLALSWGAVAGTESPASVARSDAVQPTPPPVAEVAWWREGVGLLGSLWDDARTRLRDDVPDWLHHERKGRASEQPERAAGAAYVVLQEDRPDGMDLVTLRYAMVRQGALQAYAGAGLNHAQYYVEEAATAPSMLTSQPACRRRTGGRARRRARLECTGELECRRPLVRPGRARQPVARNLWPGRRGRGNAGRQRRVSIPLKRALRRTE